MTATSASQQLRAVLRARMLKRIEELRLDAKEAAVAPSCRTQATRGSGTAAPIDADERRMAMSHSDPHHISELNPPTSPTR